jgi:hypothetical protein
VTSSGKDPHVGVGTSRIAPGVPNNQGETIRGAVIAGLQATLTRETSLYLGQLRVRLGHGASMTQVTESVRRAIAEAQKRRRP